MESRRGLAHLDDLPRRSRHQRNRPQVQRLVRASAWDLVDRHVPVSSTDHFTSGNLVRTGRRLLEQEIEAIAAGDHVVDPKRPIRHDLHGIVAPRLLSTHSDPAPGLVPDRFLVLKLVQAIIPVQLLAQALRHYHAANHRPATAADCHLGGLAGLDLNLGRVGRAVGVSARARSFRNRDRAWNHAVENEPARGIGGGRVLEPRNGKVRRAASVSAIQQQWQAGPWLAAHPGASPRSGPRA